MGSSLVLQILKGREDGSMLSIGKKGEIKFD